MFNLRQHIRRRKRCFCRAVGNDDYFTWSRNHINIHLAENEFLCRCNISVARSHYFIHLRNSLCAVCKCRYRLRATDFKYALYSAYLSRRGNQRIEKALFSRTN